MGFQALQLGETARPHPKVEYLPMAAENIARGTVCVVDDGNVTIATTALTAAAVANRTCVAIESVDNSGGSAGDLNIGVVFAPEIVAVQTKTALNPGDFLKVVTAGTVSELVDTDDLDIKVGAYVGKEAAVFSRASTTPFQETLSAGIVPDQDAAIDDIVWIQLIDK